MPKKSKAFTLIELLVVIAIIGILVTIAVIALNNARAKARDAKRIADVKQVQTALELFFNDKGRYPTSDEFLSGTIYSTSTLGTTTYMVQIPQAANPPDGDCLDTENQFSYVASPDGTTYTLSYCLGGNTGALAAGPKCATPAGMLNESCGGGSGGGCTENNWSPDPSTVCNGEAFTQNGSDCGGQQTSIGTLTCGVGQTCSNGTCVTPEDICFTNPSSCYWQTVGNVNFSNGQIESPQIFVYNGVPFVVFTDYGNYGGRLTVMKFENGSWGVVGTTAGFTDGVAYYPSLYVDNNTPYVAFKDVAHNQKITVMKCVGGNSSCTWELVGTAGFADYTTYQDKLLVDNGVPYVAYNQNGSVRVQKYTGQGATGWEMVGDTSTYQSNDLDLKMYNGTLYLAYEDMGNDRKATVKRCINSELSCNWEAVGTTPGLSTGWALHLSLDIYNGTPYMAYRDYDLNSKATVIKCNGGSSSCVWELVGSSAGITPAEAYPLSLDVYNGVPYLAFVDYSFNPVSSPLSVIKYTGNGANGWEAVGNSGFSGGSVASSVVSLDVYNGTPYAAYGDGTIGNDSGATVKKFSQ